MTVSWVATASNSTVESSARIVLFDSAPHSAATSRTASKIRSGHPLARSLWRHSVNTLASKPPSSMPSPAAAFQRTSQRSRSSASRSEHPSSACRTITTAITDPGTDGRPRGPKRSSNNPSGNNLRRFSAKNRCTDPSRTRPPHKPKVSNSSRSSFSVPCIPHDPTPHTRSRAPRPELLSTLLADRLYRTDGGRDNPHARTRAQCRHDALLTLVGIEPAPSPHPELRSTSPNTDPGSPNTNPNGHHTSPNGHHTSPDAASNGNARPKLSTPRQPLLPVPNVSPATDPPADPLFNPEPSQTRTLGSLPGIVCGSGSGVGSGEVPEVISRAGPGSGSGVGSGEVPEVISRAGPGSGSGVGSGEVPEVISRAGPGVGLDTMSGLSPGVSLGCTCGRGLGTKAQLCIVMDVTYLATNGERGRCEIPGVGAIARSELERLGCDPEIYGILFDERGLSLHHGRKTRRVSPQQWRVLLARDRGCVICGAHPNWCQAHHVKYWSLGGLTDIDNLALLCHAHHRWVHDNEITLRRGTNGWHAPAGLPSPRRPSRQPIHSS